MGGDISVFNENELESDFWKYYGPKDENVLSLAERSWNGMFKKIKYRRMNYEDSDLIGGLLFNGEDICYSKFNLPSSNGNIVGGLWADTPLDICKSKVCVIYLHTNSRSHADAIEILPLCEGFLKF